MYSANRHIMAPQFGQSNVHSAEASEEDALQHFTPDKPSSIKLRKKPKLNQVVVD